MKIEIVIGAGIVALIGLLVWGVVKREKTGDAFAQEAAEGGFTVLSKDKISNGRTLRVIEHRSGACFVLSTTRMLTGTGHLEQVGPEVCEEARK